MFLNKSRAEPVMEKNGLDGLVATTPENVAFLTGFAFWPPGATGRVGFTP